MTFEEVLALVGFPGVAAQQQLGQVQRKRDLGLQTLKMAGEEERYGIDTGMESRGLLRSSVRDQALARQAGREAQRRAQIEQASADDIANINLGLQEQITLAKQQQQYQQQVDALVNLRLQQALDWARKDYAEVMDAVAGGSAASWGY